MTGKTEKIQPPLIGIAAVERDTGLGKDTLRVWERRYGFPQPQRDALGERAYPAAQVERLRLIKRLLDHGLRPGALIGESDAALRSRIAALPAPETDAAPDLDWLLPVLQAADVARLRSELGQRLAHEGLRQFVMHTLPSLNLKVGTAWLQGSIGIFEEHLYSEQIQNLLRAATFSLPRGGPRPQILLTTFKDEEHVLGLLMSEALLVADGAWCLSLGAQTPVNEIVQAVLATTTDIVGISVSSAYPWRKARDAIAELRAQLPPRVDLWLGGGGLVNRDVSADGIRHCRRLDEIPAMLADWRARHA